MENDKLTPEQYRKLKQACDLLGDVQVERLRQGKEHQELYRLRCQLGREFYRLRPENWASL